MSGNTDTRGYNPLDRKTFEAIAYNAVGRGSETNTYPAYRLTHSKGQSGWSVGLMQWDFGQPGRREKVADLLSGYQEWAPADSRFSEAEVASLSMKLQTPGQRDNAISADEQTRLNGYLRSDTGREFVNGLDREQIAYKWNNVGRRLSQIDWLQDLAETDPRQASEIVAMTSKRFNQGERRGRELIGHLEGNEMASKEVADWIATVSALPPANADAIISGRDGALAAVRLLNDLELGNGRLSRAWQEEVHANGNVGLTAGFNSNPNVQLFDAMMRNPAAGTRILDHIDEGRSAQITVIAGANADAHLEISRVELSRNGVLNIQSPIGDRFEMTEDGWSRNGIPMQAPPHRERDRPDHMGPGMRLGDAPAERDFSESPVDRHFTRRPFDDPYLDRAFAALMAGDSDQLDRVAAEFTQSPDGQRMVRQGDELYAQQQLQEQQQIREQQAQEQALRGPVISR